MGGTPTQVQMGGGVSHPADWGMPHQDLMGYPNVQDSMVYPTPHPGLDGVSPIRRQISKASTCYMAGSVPLAFMQEDFLVCRYVCSKTIMEMFGVTFGLRPIYTEQLYHHPFHTSCIAMEYTKKVLISPSPISLLPCNLKSSLFLRRISKYQFQFFYLYITILLFPSTLY